MSGIGWYAAAGLLAVGLLASWLRLAAQPRIKLGGRRASDRRGSGFREYRILIQNENELTSVLPIQLTVEVVNGSWFTSNDPSWEKTVILFHGPQSDPSRPPTLDWQNGRLVIDAPSGPPAFATWALVCRTTLTATGLRVSCAACGPAWLRSWSPTVIIVDDEPKTWMLGSVRVAPLFLTLGVLAMLVPLYLLVGSPEQYSPLDHAWAFGSASVISIAFTVVADVLSRRGNYPLVQGFLGWDVTGENSVTRSGGPRRD